MRNLLSLMGEQDGSEAIIPEVKPFVCHFHFSFKNCLLSFPLFMITSIVIASDVNVTLTM